MRIFTCLFTFFILQAVQHLQAQTSFSWTGANSSDWANSGNWSPAGIPGAGHAVSIGSATNNPVLDSNRSIASLSMSSGSELDLGGYALTLSSGGDFSMSRLSNGMLISADFHAEEARFGVQIITYGSNFTSLNSRYSNPGNFTFTGSALSASGGNSFLAPVYLTHLGSGTWNFGSFDSPDVFEDSLIALCDASGQLVFGSSSTDNQMLGYCLFKRGINASNNAICIGSDVSDITFFEKVELASQGATGTKSTIGVKFEHCLFENTASLSIHSDGFLKCQLSLVSCDVRPPVALALSGSASLLLSQATVFRDSAIFTAPSCFLHKTTFEKYTSITKTGTEIDQSPGPIVSLTDIHLINTGNGSLFFDGATDEEFQHVYLRNEGPGTLAFARKAGNSVVFGNLDITCLDGLILTGVYSNNRTLNVEGEITTHCYAGQTILGRMRLGTSGSIVVDTLDGVLKLENFDYDATIPFVVDRPAGEGRLILSTGSEFASKVKLTVPRIQMTGVTFHDSLIVNCHVQGLASSGGLTCHGAVVLNAYNSTGIWELNYASVTSTYHQDVYMNRFGAGQVDFGLYGSHHFKKNLYFNGTGALGTSGVYNNHMTFNGSENQIIASTNSHTAPLSRLNVDKPSGQLQINSKVSIWTNLNLTKGHVVVDDAGSLTMYNTCTLSGGSDSSYVQGSICKSWGTAEVTYPLGADGVYAPLKTTAVHTNNTIKVSYFNEDPDSLYSRSSKDTTIGFVNRCGYWKVERLAGNVGVIPTLGWSNNPCYSTSPVDASVAQWDGSTWKDKGNAAYSGTSTAGNVKSTAAITTYPAILNLGGICNLQAELSANRDTLIEGYLATFTASPANQYNYKFYVNDSLFQEGQSNSFKTHILQQGDSVSVFIMNLDSCFGGTYMNIHTTQPTTFSYNFNFTSNPAVFAKEEIVLDSNLVLSVAGDVFTAQIDSNRINIYNGAIITDSSAINLHTSELLEFIEACNTEGGVILNHSDTVPYLKSGLYRIIEGDSLNETIVFNSVNSDIFLFKEGNLHWSNVNQIGMIYGDTSSNVHLIIEDTIIIHGRLPERVSIYANTVSIADEMLINGHIYALNKAYIKSNTIVNSAAVIANCNSTTNDECQQILNGNFTNLKSDYLLQGESLEDLSWLKEVNSPDEFLSNLARFQASYSFDAGVVCNWKIALPNLWQLGNLSLVRPYLTNASTSHQSLLHPRTGIQTSQPFAQPILGGTWAKISFKYRRPETFLLYNFIDPTAPIDFPNNNSQVGQLFPILSESPVNFSQVSTIGGQSFQYMPSQSLIGNEVFIINSSELNGISNPTFNNYETFVELPSGYNYNYFTLIHTVADGINDLGYNRIEIDEIKIETCCVSPFNIESTNDNNDYIRCSEILAYAENNSYLNEIFSQSQGGPLVLDVGESSLAFPPEVIFGKTLWVDIDFEINGSTVMMMDNLNIIVLDGNRLTIDNSSIVGCQVKWGSIYVQTNAELIVRNNSTIEDAKAAIFAYGSAYTYIDAATITFTNSKILDCNQGIIINGSVSSTGNYPLTFHSSEITTSPGGHLHNSRLEYNQNLSNPGSVLPPSRGVRGIDIRYSGALVSIGSGWGSLSQNKISKLEQGIRVLSANFNSVNLHIEDIYSATSSYSNNSFSNLQTSAAIVLDAVPGLPSRTVSLTSSIGQLLGGNSIENCANGVIGKVGGYSSVSVRFSIINQVNEAISFSKYIKCIFTIDVNNITYSSRYGVRFNSNSKCKLTIKNNEISNTNGTANANAGGVGLQILHPLSNSNTSALVTNNIIKNYQVGIYASNLNGGSVTQYYPPEGQNTSMGNYFADNEVTLKPYLYNPFYDFTTGYYFNNCGKSYFYHNAQNTFNTSIINNSAGFYFSSCVRANIICNSSEYTTYSNLFTLGDQHLTFAGNLMKNGNYGVYLLGSTIGKQGFDNDYSKLSNLNSWYPFDNPLSGGFSNHLYVESTDGTNSEFFLKCITCSTGVGEATSPYPFLSNSIESLFPIIPFSNQTHIYSLFRMDNSTCWEHGLSDGPLTISTPDEGAGDSPFMKRYKAIQVADTSNSNDAQRIYDATFELYSDLMYDEGYLENDTLEDFVDSLETENIGKFYLIDQELSNKIAADTTLDLSKETSKLDDRITNIENMQAISDSITTSGVFEQAHHQVLNLLLAEELKNLANLDSMYTYLNTSTNIDSLLHIIDTDSILHVAWTNAEKDSIETLAEKCAFTNGKSIINARAIWSTFDTLAVNIMACEIPNPSSSRISGIQISEATEDVSSISIYPNPAKGSFTISIPNNEEGMLIELIDVSGRIVKSINLNPSDMQVVDVSSISAGWYAVSVTRPISGRFVKPIFIEN